MNPEARKMLPKLAFTSFASRFQEPTIKEGFEEVMTVDFAVGLLASTLPMQHPANPTSCWNSLMVRMRSGECGANIGFNKVLDASTLSYYNCPVCLAA